jgi:diguanylate cyclase (GGDEF)-like protein
VAEGRSWEQWPFLVEVPVPGRWAGRAVLHLGGEAAPENTESFRINAGDLAAVAGELLGHYGSAPVSAVDPRDSATHLRELHRLTTTEYSRLEDLFADFLRTGRDIFSLPFGAIVEVHGEGCLIRASVGPDGQSAAPMVDMAACREELKLRRTCLHRRSRGVCLCARVEIENQMYGILSFWSNEANPACLFRSQERDLLELMAKSIGQFLREQRLTARLSYQANHDAVTGLPNRHAFELALSKAIEDRAELVPAILYLDLDRFKQVNDSLGHAAGDDVLREIGRRIAAGASEAAGVARIGGDEFAVLLLDRTALDVQALAERLLAAVSQPIAWNSHELYLTASIGLSQYPGDGGDADTLLKHADAAMYEVKDTGRNNYARFRPGVAGRQPQRLQLESALRRALENEEFELLWQPQVTSGGGLAGFEVLLAWKHPVLGQISPQEFIPIAEENGLILPIGEWVLSAACRQARHWQSRGFAPVRIAVNVSPIQFADPGIVELVARVVDAAEFDSNRLELEVTENSVMRDVEESARRMASLRALGVSISVDDFGTGYSSLSYLQRLPVDTLKIDKSFLRDLGRSSEAMALVEAIISLAHARHLTVVAEGVEREEQWRLLCSAGCDLGQGHYFAQPLPTIEAERLLKHPAALSTATGK